MINIDLYFNVVETSVSSLDNTSRHIRTKSQGRIGMSDSYAKNFEFAEIQK